MARRHPLMFFFVLAFAFSWVVWAPAVFLARGPSEPRTSAALFHLAGGLGPMLSAFVITALAGGSAGVRELLGRVLRWQVGLGWWLVAVAGPAILFLLAAEISRFLFGGWPEATRALNKRIGNPVMMKLAGRRNWFAGTIHHTGRHTGREYATPVWAVPTPDGFLISLPFGEGVDWLKNVLAAGRATIETRGETWEVVDPEVVDRETVQPLLAGRVRVLFALAGIERYLKVKSHSNASSATAS